MLWNAKKAVVNVVEYIYTLHELQLLNGLGVHNKTCTYVIIQVLSLNISERNRLRVVRIVKNRLPPSPTIPPPKKNKKAKFVATSLPLFL